MRTPTEISNMSKKAFFKNKYQFLELILKNLKVWRNIIKLRLRLR